MFQPIEQLRDGTFNATSSNPAGDKLPAIADNLDAQVRRGRRLRAEAFARFGRAVTTRIGAFVMAQAEAYRHWRDVCETERELRRLSPEALRDIGIEGHQIAAIARGLDHNRDDEPQTRASVTRLPAKAKHIEAPCCVGNAA